MMYKILFAIENVNTHVHFVYIFLDAEMKWDTRQKTKGGTSQKPRKETRPKNEWIPAPAVNKKMQACVLK
jgi:hypothetical protein